MAKGRCLKCDDYGDVEKHHPLPQRWFGRGPKNNWTEPLCAECHKTADRITQELDHENHITNGSTARYFRALFEQEFASFINGRFNPTGRHTPRPNQPATSQPTHR